jgi:Domain of unknown function (DUF6430)/Effector-associated domain 2
MTGSADSAWTAHLTEKLVDALAACSDMDDPAFRVQFLTAARERLGAARAFQVSSGGDAQQFIRAIVRASRDHKAPGAAVSALRQAMGAVRPDSRAATLLAECEQVLSANTTSGDRPGSPAGVSSSGESRVPDDMILDLDEIRRLAEAALEDAGSERGGADGGLAFDNIEVHAATVTFTGSLHAGRQRVLVRVNGPAASQPSDWASFYDRVRRAREVSSHPSTARLLDAGFTELGYPFTVQVIDRPVTRYSSTLVSDKIIEIGAKLADVFFYAHNHGVIIGGIGPSDLLLTSEGEPVLVLPRLPTLPLGGAAAPGWNQDVYGLSAALLLMLDRSQQADEAENRLVAQARHILQSGMDEQPQLRPTTLLLRDQLNALTRDPVRYRDDSDISLRFAVRRKPPRADIILTVGDLLNERIDLVIAFSDTFDTVPDGVVIHPSSLQGQLVKRLYGDNVEELDRDLSRALSAVPVALTENRNAKARGKLTRYPIGTVATLEQGHRRIFAVAVSHMGNDLIAQSSHAFLDRSLSLLWREVRRHDRSRSIAMPIIGSGLSRVDLSHTSLLLEIMSSFVKETQRETICRQLRMVVYPSNLESLDMNAIIAFARSLSSK